jgi:hypothetical protein
LYNSKYNIIFIWRYGMGGKKDRQKVSSKTKGKNQKGLTADQKQSIEKAIDEVKSAKIEQAKKTK